MNYAKETYIVMSTLFGLTCLILSVVTPLLWGGSYLWSVGLIILLFLQSSGFTKRLNSWGDLGVLDE